MPDLMAAADLAVTRAGAATVSELAAARLPAILIPSPYAMADHQRANAAVLEAAGAAVVVDQAQAVASGRLEGLVGDLLKEKNRLVAMSEAAHRCAKVDAADRIAEIALEMASPDRAEE
jgi:UDP-N-acetylglucosamine--N-acetylmuramyl-(pentapeptide) pyrophosphoryl-undecaprenol N-acetylglucosamine transferase